MIVDVVKGNLIELALQNKYDAIVHGCNCFIQMGSGIAKQIKLVFPEAFAADYETVKGDKEKLGTYTYANIDYEYKGKENKVAVINAYTQYTYNAKDKPIDYDAIRKVFTLINKDYADMNIGIPKIGAGLAGGDWNKISAIIDEVTPKLDVHLVEFK